MKNKKKENKFETKEFLTKMADNHLKLALRKRNPHPREAVLHCLENLELRKRIYEMSSDKDDYRNLGDAYYNLGVMKDVASGKEKFRALYEYQKAYDIFLEAYGEEHENTVKVSNIIKAAELVHGTLSSEKTPAEEYYEQVYRKALQNEAFMRIIYEFIAANKKGYIKDFFRSKKVDREFNELREKARREQEELLVMVEKVSDNDKKEKLKRKILEQQLREIALSL